MLLRPARFNKASRVVAGVVAFVGAGFADRPVHAADAARAPTTAGCLAAAESSLALRSQHKLRDARAQLLICSAPSCPTDVRAECIRRVAEINTALPSVVFEAKDGDGNDLVEVTVTLDGQPLADRLDGPALVVDPGVHSFVFEASGQPPVRKQFVIREGDKDRRERITLGSVAAVPPRPEGRERERERPRPASSEGNQPALGASPDQLPPPPLRLADPPSRRDAPEPSSTRRLAAFGFGALALAGLGTGIAFHVLRENRVAEAKELGCSHAPNGVVAGSNTCAWLYDRETSARNVAIGGYAIAGLGALTAFVLSTDSGDPHESNWKGLTLVTLGIGAIATGGAFHSAHESHVVDYNQCVTDQTLPARPQACASIHSDEVFAGRVAVAGYVGGAALLGAGVLVLALHPPPAKEVAVSARRSSTFRCSAIVAGPVQAICEGSF
jgi:hypothetical protein